MTLAIELVDLKKTFVSGFFRKKVEAVRGISFTVEVGECVGLVGPNGAGKTTSLKALTGLLRPTAGEARVFGQPAAAPSSRATLGYLPENPYFYEHLTPTELLNLYGRLFGLDRRTLRERVPALIERVGLTFAADRQVKKFSKGMRQRVGIAQALINDPKLVILDEPQSGLDPEGRRDIRDLIVELHKEGKTILMCTHVLPDVQAVCSRVVSLQRGLVHTIADIGTVRARANEYEVILSSALGQDAPYTLHSERDDLAIYIVPTHAEVQALLAHAVQHDVDVYSVTPRVPDLEELLFEQEVGS